MPGILNPILLIVDDDQNIRELLADFLKHHHYQVLTAANSYEMFLQLAQHPIALIILDNMLKDTDGFTLCARIRENSDIPLVMLSALNEETDRLRGFDAGADDYLAKPFSPRELAARINAILRRCNTTISRSSHFADIDTEHYGFAGWRIHRGTRTLHNADKKEIALSTGEYGLLNAFLDHPRRVLSRDQLLEITHNRSAGPFDRSIDIQVSRLRQKIEVDPKKPEIIKTVRGGGYLFTPLVSRAPN